MLNIRSSTAEAPNRAFKEVRRKKSEENLAWLERHLSTDADSIQLLLVGGTGAGDFRLRIAQSHLRHDMTPSHWSHVGLVGQSNGEVGDTLVYEIALEPEHGFGFAAPTNAVQEGRLGAYADRKRYPNLALLTLPVARAELEDAIARFQHQRSVLDATELVLLWLAFLWGVGRAGNPLLSGNGIPSAAMVEVVLGAVGYEITPGLESRASCPEAIWQAARWWHLFYSEQQQQPPTGAWTTEHFLVD